MGKSAENLTSLLLLLFLVGCVNYDVSYRSKCVGCDNDLSKWKEDCLPMCLDIQQYPDNYNMTIPQTWELSGVQKQQFVMKTIVGESGTSNQVNCICNFQKLSQSEHDKALMLFKKIDMIVKSNLTESVNTTNIMTEKSEVHNLNYTLKNIKDLNFYPPNINSFILTAYDQNYYNKLSKYSEQSWINYTFSYLKDSNNKIIHQYIEENQSYWEWTAPPYQGGQSKLIGYIYTKKDILNGKYIITNSNYGFTIYVNKYITNGAYDKIKERWISGIKNSPDGDGNSPDIFFDKDLNVEVLDGGNGYLIFIPQINTIIQIDFKIVYAKKKGNYIETDWVEHDYTLDERKTILEGYLGWLANSNN